MEEHTVKRRSTTTAVSQGMRALLLLLALLLASAGCNTTEPPIETSPSEESSTGEETTTLEETTDTNEEMTEGETTTEEETTEEETTSDGSIITSYGTLPVEKVLEIKENYLIFVNETSYPIEQLRMKWLGEFNGVNVVFMEYMGYSDGWGNTEYVAELSFYIPSGYDLYVYQEGAFYTLEKAYENKLLTYEDLLVIQER